MSTLAKFGAAVDALKVLLRFCLLRCFLNVLYYFWGYVVLT